MAPSLASPNTDFIWLFQHDQKDADLLVVRVTSAGKVLPAMVLFASPNWTSEASRSIIELETKKMSNPEDVTIGFKDDPLHKCLSHPTAKDADLQFCAVLPLIDRPLGRAHTRSYLEPLVTLLGLSKLVKKVLKANEQWCHESCDLSRDDCGPFVLCDSTKCNVGWYHIECVQFDVNSPAKQWFCDDCRDTGYAHLSKYEYLKYEAEVNDTIDERVRCARNISQVWNNHNWPNTNELLRIINSKISFQMDRQVTVEYLKNKNGNALQCWAIPRNNLSHIYLMLSTNRRSNRLQAKLLAEMAS